MSYRRLAVVIVVAAFCAACKQPERPAARAAAGPQVRATVVTVRTTIQPENRSHLHSIVIAGDLARNISEHDVWRLYDVKKRTVTFVDDVGKTIRTEPWSEVIRRRRAATAGSLPAHYPRAKLTRTGTRRTIGSVAVEQSVIESGTYRRELWMGRHPSIPVTLFAMMHESETPSTPLAPMMRAVDDAIASLEGFPLADHSEVTYGTSKIVVDRNVVGVVQKDVPEALITLPKGYADVTPKPKK